MSSLFPISLQFYLFCIFSRTVWFFHVIFSILLLTISDTQWSDKFEKSNSWRKLILIYHFLIFFGDMSSHKKRKKQKKKKKWVAYKYFGFTIFLSTGFARVMLLLTLFHSLLLFIIFIFISLSLLSPFFILFFDILFYFIFSSHFFSHPKIRKLAILKNWKK